MSYVYGPSKLTPYRWQQTNSKICLQFFYSGLMEHMCIVAHVEGNKVTIVTHKDNLTRTHVYELHKPVQSRLIFEIDENILRTHIEKVEPEIWDQLGGEEIQAAFEQYD